MYIGERLDAIPIANPPKMRQGTKTANEAASPVPRFAAVVCEDIERSARDMLSALRLEKQLTAQGIPLFATDEPADIAGMNATTVLVRRVKQGVAEWYRIQLKEKVWKGLAEHSMDGWNIGPAPYGYQAERVSHPVPVKAAQGRTKTRLALDPERAPVVAQIYTWRTVDKFGIPEITDRLNADHDACPPPNPATGWTASGVHSILSNPKYTGHMVFGRRRTHAGARSRASLNQFPEFAVLQGGLFSLQPHSGRFFRASPN